MSAPLLDRVLGLRELTLRDEAVQVGFAHELPLWAWALIGCACVGVAAWSYSRLLGDARARAVLAGARALTLLVLALLIAQPRAVRQTERVERDWVVVLADRSGSMQVADVPGVDGRGGRVTREEELRGAYAALTPVLADLAQRRSVLRLGFDARVSELPSDGTLPAATGGRTALGAALDETLRRVAGQPVAGIVLLSDGRTFDAPSRGLMQQLRERGVPVFAVPLGSAEGATDFAITQATAPGAAFTGDAVPVTVEVAQLAGGAGSAGAAGARVQLVDASGAVLDEVALQDAQGEGNDDGRTRVTLSSVAREAGRLAWSVRLALAEPDLSDANNQQSLNIEMIDRPIRVLHVDGYPRWEYRYLKNLLLRESSIRATSLLLAADRRSIQEGVPVAQLPRTAQEWAEFDVVILGDVRPGLFSEEQLGSLREHVAVRGAGLLVQGGESFSPGAWRGTALEDLIPVRLSGNAGSAGAGGNAGGLRAHAQPVLLAPGEAASAYGVLRLGQTAREPWPEFLTNARLGWPLLRWAQRVEPASLKPSAEVLASALPVLSGNEEGGATGSERFPLVVTMRYGAGRTLYIATDETWRLRFGRGETLTERFWVPMVRLLARGSLGRTGKPAVIEATPEVALVGQPVRIVVRLLDQSLVASAPQGVGVVISSPAAEGAGVSGGTSLDTGVALTLSSERGGESRDGSDAGIATYAGLWVPEQAGERVVIPTEPILSGLDLSARVRVVLPEDELREPQADHATLVQLTSETGGRMLTSADLAGLDDLLPNREVRILATPEVETLWDKPWALILVMTLLVAEWIGRRLVKLS